MWGLRNLPIIELPSFSSDATVAGRVHLSSDISDTSQLLAGALLLYGQTALGASGRKE
jgi:hypothetical protein